MLGGDSHFPGFSIMKSEEKSGQPFQRYQSSKCDCDMDLELAHIYPKHQRQAFASRICKVYEIVGVRTREENSLRVVQDGLPAKEGMRRIESTGF